MVDRGVLIVRIGSDGPGLMRCVRVLGPGQTHGLCRALCRQSAPTEEVRALTETAIVQVAWADLEDSLRHRPGVGADMLTAIGRYLALDDYRLARSYCETITANLAMEILLLHHMFRDERPMDVLSSGFDRCFLADLLGVSRQSTFRALHELREAGVIRTQGRAIEVLDEAGLRRLARVEHAPAGISLGRRSLSVPLADLPRPNARIANPNESHRSYQM